MLLWKSLILHKTDVIQVSIGDEYASQVFFGWNKYGQVSHNLGNVPIDNQMLPNIQV